LKPREALAGLFMHGMPSGSGNRLTLIALIVATTCVASCRREGERLDALANAIAPESTPRRATALRPPS
jgi:hypothetical protein